MLLLSLVAEVLDTTATRVAGGKEAGAESWGF